MLATKLQQCQSQAKSALGDIDGPDREILDSVAQFPVRGHFNSLFESFTSGTITIQKLTKSMTDISGFLSDDEGKATFREFLRSVMPLLSSNNSERYVQAVTNYLKCIIANLDYETAEALRATVGLILSIIGLFEEPGIKSLSHKLKENLKTMGTRVAGDLNTAVNTAGSTNAAVTGGRSKSRKSSNRSQSRNTHTSGQQQQQQQQKQQQRQERTPPSQGRKSREMRSSSPEQRRSARK